MAAVRPGSDAAHRNADVRAATHRWKLDGPWRTRVGACSRCGVTPMFTWVCPSCGKEWDVAVKECADCAAAKRDRPQAALPQPRSDLRFWLLLGAAALIGIVAVVSLVRYQARRPPREATPARVVLEQPSAPKNPEPVPESASNAPGSDIEVAGIRMSY